jgi:hypothetical protein
MVASTFILFLLFTNLIVSNCIAPSQYQSSLKWIQKELEGVSHAQTKIIDTLSVIHNIPIGQRITNKNKIIKLNKRFPKISISSFDNPIECRISLCAIPIGKKAVSPCGCTGSQKV